MDNLINVGLYGDGSRNARRRAEYIYCEKAQECSAYKEGRCFCVTTLFGVSCKVGRVERVDGGTKQSKAFYTVSETAKSNEKYSKLKYPCNVYITKIGEKVFLTPPYIRIEELGDNDLSCHDPGFGCNNLLTDSQRLTPQNIHKICSYTPQALLGGTISKYQTDIVPMFLKQLSKVFPERYFDFVSAYPNFEIKQVNYVGMRAKLSTCNRLENYKDHNGNVFHFEGDFFVCENWKSAFNPFSSKESYIKVKVNDSMIVTITDNNQVTDDTVFE